MEMSSCRQPITEVFATEPDEALRLNPDNPEIRAWRDKAAKAKANQN